MYPTFVNDSTLLIYQETNIRILDISNRANIVQRAQWNLASYPITSLIYAVQAINSSCAFVAIGTPSTPAKIFLFDMSNTASVVVLKTLTLSSSTQNPSNFTSSQVKAISVVFTDTHAYWATSTQVLRIDFATFTLSTASLPKPYDISTGSSQISRLSVYKNATQVILTIACEMDGIFLDVTSMTNVFLIDAVAGSGKSMRK